MKTAIEWTELTWNPVTGCSKVSLGCQHCYAERMARRLRAMGNARYRNGFRVTLHPDMLALPTRWTQPRLVFVNSMSDLFHPEVPLSFIREVFEVMERASQHTFQVLTKRARRLASLAPKLPWPPNVWVGATVEAQEYTWRIDCLREVPAAVRFISLEPLLGMFEDLPLHGVDWVICGGESGPRARPMRAEWARAIRDRCTAAGVPFFFKQWGGVYRKRSGRRLGGRVWNEYPAPRADEAPPQPVPVIARSYSVLSLFHLDSTACLRGGVPPVGAQGRYGLPPRRVRSGKGRQLLLPGAAKSRSWPVH
jgi:protein gp37